MSVRTIRPANIHDPDFCLLCAAWAKEMTSEIEQTVILTRAAIAESRALMAQADRLLVRR
jgi:hypothetical protein